MKDATVFYKIKAAEYKEYTQAKQVCCRLYMSLYVCICVCVSDAWPQEPKL